MTETTKLIKAIYDEIRWHLMQRATFDYACSLSRQLIEGHTNAEKEQ